MGWEDMNVIYSKLNSLEEDCRGYSWKYSPYKHFKDFLPIVQGWHKTIVSELEFIFDKEYNIIRSKFDKNSYNAIQNGMDIAARRNEFKQKLENLTTALTEFDEAVKTKSKRVTAFDNWKTQVDDCIKFEKDIYSWLEEKSKKFKGNDAKRVWSNLTANAKDLLHGAGNELKNVMRNAKTEASDVSEDIENAKIWKVTLGKSNKEKIKIYKQQIKTYESRINHLKEKDGGLYYIACSSSINLKIFFDNLAQYSLLKAKMSKFLSLINELKRQIASADSIPDATPDFKNQLSQHRQQLDTLEQKGRQKFNNDMKQVKASSVAWGKSLRDHGYELNDNKQLSDIVNCLSANSENTKAFGDELVSKQNKFIIEMKKLERLIDSCKENLQKLGYKDVTVDHNKGLLDNINQNMAKLDNLFK